MVDHGVRFVNTDDSRGRFFGPTPSVGAVHGEWGDFAARVQAGTVYDTYFLILSSTSLKVTSTA